MGPQTSEDQGELSDRPEQVQRPASPQAIREEMDTRWRKELDAQREELNRELVRRAFRIGELEHSLQRLEQQSQELLTSLSWRITKPLRAAKAFLGELRRR